MSIFSNLIVTIVFGMGGLVLIAISVIGLPYIVGKLLMRIRIMTLILDNLDPWTMGMIGLIITGIIIAFGTLLRAALGL